MDELNALVADVSDENAHVQVPAGILTSFIATVENLQEELGATKSNLASIQQHIGVQLFPQFTNLPSELRRMIWEFASRVPQIHRITDTTLSRSSINAIAGASKESASVLEDMALPRFHKRDDIGDIRTNCSYAKSYVNLNIDTFWLCRGHYNTLIDQYLDLYCLECEDLETVGQKICSRCNPPYLHFAPKYGIWRGIHCIETLAVNYDKWIGPVENLEAFFLLNLELLIYHSVKELLLVVGAGCQTLSSDPDVFFVPVPQHLVLPDTDSPGDIRGWNQRVDDVVQSIETYKMKRQMTRDALILRGGRELEHEFEFNEDWEELRTLENWIVLKVTFVLAVTQEAFTQE